MLEKPKRRIRSFVRREGRITPGQSRALEQYWPIWGMNREEGEAGWQAKIDATKKVTLDIGFGMGDSLLQLASRDPDQQFVGIEVHRPGVGSLFLRMHASGIENVSVYRDDAVDVLKECIPNESIDTILLFFPDPWHKKRHHKRRILQQTFLDLLIAKLKPGGIFHFATDWEDYAMHARALLESEARLENTVEGFAKRPESRPLTRFEQRGMRKGHGVWDLIFRRM